MLTPPKWSLLAFFVVLPALSFTVILCTLAHKETRFLVPVFPALFIALGACLGVLAPRAELLYHAIAPRFLRKRRVIFALAGVVLCTWTVQSTRSALARPLDLTTVDVTDLEYAIARDHGLAPNGRSCVVTVDHNFSWLRGKLAAGSDFGLIDEHLATLRPRDAARCVYAIVRTDEEVGFRAIAPEVVWMRLARARTSSYVLLVRRSPR